MPDRLTEEFARLHQRFDQLHGRIEAMVQVHLFIKARHPLPPMRGWAIAPDLALTLVSVLTEHKPVSVVEFGPGVSTLVIGYLLKQFGKKGHLVSFEHDEQNVEVQRAEVKRHKLQSFVTIVHAPLKPMTMKAKKWKWYAADTVAAHLPDVIDMVFVDGPPSAVQRLSRYPALPVVLPRLRPGSVVLLDDAHRPDEQEILRLWQEAGPELFDRQVIDNEKGAALWIRR
jgi:predicted O-methyltransferase YrrM